MRLVNINGRAALQTGGGALDVYRASRGRFGPRPLDVLDEWHEFVSWANGDELTGHETWPGALDAPIPDPRQIFAIGLNYVDHAHGSGLAPPDEPVVFTKFASSLCGPVQKIALPEGNVDWEVEMVVVIGRETSEVARSSAWSYVAGLMVGQDLSERRSQFQGDVPQFSLAKSHKGFGPIGPALVTLDEIPDPDDLAITCRLNGNVVQEGSTRDMIFPVSEILARLSRVVTLYPGDLIFTGTPPGVGYGRTPPEFLQVGDRLESHIEGIGHLSQEFVAADHEASTPSVGAVAST